MKRLLASLALLLAAASWAGPPPLPVTALTYTNITEGVTTQQALTLGATQAKLARLIVASANCADCDIAITTATGTGATQLVYENTTMGASTVNGVAYSTYVNAINLGLVVPDAALQVFVRITNNDAEATNDEDVTVRLEWESL